ncbi:MAG: peptide chain release factor N(5)-glutamine methyltransferase [Candidatus Gracilibacteria bacterium]|nr:peptide chain release factor N(5)-glutamine methyltransferase [Candidatus Gracilibacteria bacterium]
MEKGLKNSHIEMILSHFLGLDKTRVFLLEDIPEDNIRDIEKVLNRLLSGEPIEYIINKADFYGREFYVDNRVLVPRNETELMVEKVLENIKKSEKKREKYDFFIDFGTGSCAMPISIFLNNNKKNINYFAVDISDKALEVAKKNAENYKANIKLKQSDLANYFLESLDELKGVKNVIITANLPYIKNRDFINMDQEVIFFEPSVALYGGEETGFELYEKLTQQLLELKEKLSIEKIVAFYEIGFDQYEVSKEFLEKKGLKFDYFKDFNNIYRTIKVEFI